MMKTLTMPKSFRLRQLRWPVVQGVSIPLQERSFNLATGMTLVLLFFHVQSEWYLILPVHVLCLMAVLYRPLVRMPVFWLLIAAIMFVGQIPIWYYIDNHKYLITYWCLALGVSLFLTDAHRVLARNARLLIGLVFLMATLWKAISIDYLSGSFFQNILLTDERFFGVSAFIGGANDAALKDNLERFQDYIDFAPPHMQLLLAEGARTHMLAELLTWWTIVVEGLIAACFLLPERTFLGRWRDVVLLAFMVTTYPIASVKGFGWVLCAMGVAQSNYRRFSYMPLLYVGAFIYILFCDDFPFGRAFARLAGL